MTPQEISGDLLVRFGQELMALLERYESLGVCHESAWRRTFVDPEPSIDEATGQRFSRRKRGPIIELDLKLADEFRDARPDYPFAWKAINDASARETS